MIVFDLECRSAGHRFEGWFGSSDDFARQQERGLVACPLCGSADVDKAVMAPNLGRKGNQVAEVRPAKGPATPPGAGQVTTAGPPLAPEAIALFRAVAAAQAEALKSSRWVADDFAEKARAMHYGEEETQPIHGQATADQARDLIDEGIAVAPLLVPVVPPEQAN